MENQTLKYGVVVCKDTLNIGDDIQSYAASCLLPSVDYYIEREHMDVFRPKEDRPVNAIINGWFMNNKLGWPLSACINPLYVSMHFCEDDAMLVKSLFLEGLGSEDLKAHAPVGARDYSTQMMLERNGIPSYFSGCLTLTLPPKFKKDVVKSYICLTDISEGAADYIQKKYSGITVKVIEHEPKKLPPLVNKESSWKERFAEVENLLEIYQNATAVVTTRLHCALPCLALGTPVLLLNDDDLFELGRLDGLSELVHTAKTSEFIADLINFDLKNPPRNPESYLQIRNELIHTVSQFVRENAVCTPELMERFASYDIEWEKRALWKNHILQELINKHVLQWNQNHEAFEKLEKERQWQENHIVELTKWCQELENSREWLRKEISGLVEENKKLLAANEELTNRCQERKDTWGLLGKIFDGLLKK